MIQTKHLITILNKPQIVYGIYDREMDSLARKNSGEYKVDQQTQLEVSKKAFSVVCKESVSNLTWDECVAIFDIMDRNS